MEPIYKERGGGWIGNGIITLQATWPFSSIAIYENKIIFKVGWRTAELLMSDIVAVKRLSIIPFIAEGVRIFHENKEVPKLLRFWSLGHSKKIQDLINSRLTQGNNSDFSQTPATGTAPAPKISNSR